MRRPPDAYCGYEREDPSTSQVSEDIHPGVAQRLGLSRLLQELGSGSSGKPAHTQHVPTTTARDLPQQPRNASNSDPYHGEPTPLHELKLDSTMQNELEDLYDTCLGIQNPVRYIVHVLEAVKRAGAMRCGILRHAQFVLFLIQITVNIVAVVVAAAEPLRARDFYFCPTDPTAPHTSEDAVIIPNLVVTWTEFAVVMIYLGRSIAYSFSFACAMVYQRRVVHQCGAAAGQEYGLQVMVRARMMYKSLPKLQFSLLKALSLLNPSNSYEYMRYRDAWIRDKLQNSNKLLDAIAKRLGTCAVFFTFMFVALETLLRLVLMVAAVVAVYCKLLQLHFLGQRSPAQWTLSEVMLFVQFCNNLVWLDQSYASKMIGKMELLFYGKDSASSREERKAKALFEQLTMLAHRERSNMWCALAMHHTCASEDINEIFLDDHIEAEQEQRLGGAVKRAVARIRSQQSGQPPYDTPQRDGSNGASRGVRGSHAYHRSGSTPMPPPIRHLRKSSADVTLPPFEDDTSAVCVVMAPSTRRMPAMQGPRASAFAAAAAQQQVPWPTDCPTALAYPAGCMPHMQQPALHTVHRAGTGSHHRGVSPGTLNPPNESIHDGNTANTGGGRHPADASGAVDRPKAASGTGREATGSGPQPVPYDRSNSTPVNRRVPIRVMCGHGSGPGGACAINAHPPPVQPQPEPALSAAYKAQAEVCGLHLHVGDGSSGGIEGPYYGGQSQGLWPSGSMPKPSAASKPSHGRYAYTAGRAAGQASAIMNYGIHGPGAGYPVHYSSRHGPRPPGYPLEKQEAHAAVAGGGAYALPPSHYYTAAAAGAPYAGQPYGQRRHTPGYPPQGYQPHRPLPTSYLPNGQ